MLFRRCIVPSLIRGNGKGVLRDPIGSVSINDREAQQDKLFGLETEPHTSKVTSINARGNNFGANALERVAGRFCGWQEDAGDHRRPAKNLWCTTG
jgi:hypothetical protein